MKTKRIIKWICGIAAMILAALLFLIGSVDAGAGDGGSRDAV